MKIRTAFAALVLAVTASSASFAEGPDLRAFSEKMLADGHYDQTDVSAEFIAKPPLKPERYTAKGVKAVTYGKVMTMPQVLADLDRRGLRPATIEELLAYGAAHPDEQLRYPIIALGSYWRITPVGSTVAYNVSPGLDSLHGKRDVFMHMMGSDTSWEADCRFLAVKPTIRTLGDMIEVGRYSTMISGIDERDFPVKPERYAANGLVLVTLDHDVESLSQLNAELDGRGLRPATIEELLAYGAAHRDLPEPEHKIGAFGSVHMAENGLYCRPYLEIAYERRQLTVYCGLRDDDWDTSISFLAAPK